MTEPTPTPEIPKAKPQKRPETRVRDAVRIARNAPSLVSAYEEMLNSTDPKAHADRAYAAADAQAATILANARAKRDFSREIAGLDAVSLAMVRAGIAAKTPSA